MLKKIVILFVLLTMFASISYGKVDIAKIPKDIFIKEAKDSDVSIKYHDGGVLFSSTIHKNAKIKVSKSDYISSSLKNGIESGWHKDDNGVYTIISIPFVDDGKGNYQFDVTLSDTCVGCFIGTTTITRAGITNGSWVNLTNSINASFVTVNFSLYTPVGIEIDSYALENYSGGTVDIGSTYLGYGQAFTSSFSGVLLNASFYMYKYNSPTGNMVAKLYSTTGTMRVDAKPVGSPLATSDTYDPSTLSGTCCSLFNFTFSEPYTIVSGNDYAIVVEYINEGGANYIELARDTSPTAQGNQVRKYYDYPWSGVSSQDIIYYIYYANLGNNSVYVKPVNNLQSDIIASTNSNIIVNYTFNNTLIQNVQYFSTSSPFDVITSYFWSGNTTSEFEGTSSNYYYYNGSFLPGENITSGQISFLIQDATFKSAPIKGNISMISNNANFSLNYNYPYINISTGVLNTTFTNLYNISIPYGLYYPNPVINIANTKGITWINWTWGSDQP